MPSAVEQPALSRAQRVILDRCRYLPERDAALVRSAVEGRVPINQLARMLGQHPGTLARRLQRLEQRLSDPSLALLMERARFVPDELRQLGLEHHLHGLSIRQLADRHRLSPYQIRTMLHQLQGYLRAARCGA
jgi:DNA-directed RNA polymerase specialized sigma24 family protein